MQEVFYEIGFNMTSDGLAPDTAAFSMSISDLDWQIERVLNPSVDSGRLAWNENNSLHTRWTNVSVLQTFITLTTAPIPDQEIRKVMRTAMIHLCFTVRGDLTQLKSVTDDRSSTLVSCTRFLQ